MRVETGLLAAHMVAVVMAAFSLIVLIPHPELWSGLPGASTAFAFALERAGPFHIVAGAATALALSWRTHGPRGAAAWMLVAAGLSLTMELFGTGTGWPFGNYSYTIGLGGKIADRVPWSIPLSWYYLIFSSYLLVRGAAPAAPRLLVAAASTWLLTAWDLVLDPAMAHPDQAMGFWIWHERGPYLGMPVANLLGWMLTGAVIVLVAEPLAPLQARVAPWLPYGLYVTNLGFGVVLCAHVGLLAPIALATVAGVLPATWAYQRAVTLRGDA